MTKFQNILILVTFLVTSGNTANILVMVPMPFVSHTMNFMPIFKELAIRGHNVTLVSPFPQKTPVANLTEILVPNVLNDLFDTSIVKDILTKDDFISKITILWEFGFESMPRALKFEQVQRLIHDTDSKFDLILAETFFIQEPFVAFGHKFNAPIINIMPAFFFPLSAHLTGNHLPLSYSPLNKLGYSDHMTFLERVLNFLVYYLDIIGSDLYYLNKQDAIMREYFKYPGSENLPQIQELLRTTSLTLMDYNMAVGYPVPLHKNVVLFGGINAQGPDKLPADLQKIMDDAKDGVIYLSFGSYFQISFLEPLAQDAILSAIGKLKLKVLLKLDDPSLLKKVSGKNIEIRSWFPQSEILAHPNCKLFITHGGLHGLMEAVYHAMPMVVLPFMADQIFNAKFVETVGIGVSLNKQTITDVQLLQAVDTVLHNPSYREKIKERSSIFKDQPIPTMDHVIYWIEYVIRHRGAPHLRPAVLDLHWYQYLMLDVIAFYTLIVFLILYIVKKILSLFFRCVKRIIFRDNVCKQKNKKSKKE
ncbi:UDP-glycosyltransferase UGT4-like [Rhodnius prolixus]|uniref:UDP-glucuronosyltransferase n=1 Tax=Rhodnius prolixus TaxID=13249 RepID=R4G364_RHOPR